MENRKWLEERFLNPVVIATATPDCEALCQKNGLSFLQMIKPFQKTTQSIHINVGKDVRDQHILREFGVRYFRPDGLREMDPKTRVEHFQAIMKEHGKKEINSSEILNATLEQVITEQRDSMVNPKVTAKQGRTLVQKTFVEWHDTFIKDYTSLVRCSYFDCVDHPVGFLYGVSSAGGVDAVMKRINVLASTRDKFFQSMNIPPMDTDTHQFFILFHDNSDESEGACTPQQLSAIYDTMSKAVGSQYCAVARINSNREETRKVSPQPWIDANKLVDCYATEPLKVPYGQSRCVYTLPNNTSGQVATLLTEGDVNELHHCLTRYYTLALVPWISTKLIKLMEFVDKKKTTTFSKMASWFKSDEEKAKVKQEPTFVAVGDGGPKRYLSSAVEIQMRRAGDLFMALRDFDNALKYLRLARDELNNNINDRPFNKHLIAAAQEAVGLCFFFQGRLPLPGGPKENDCRLEEARSRYINAGVHSYAFRTALILIAMCRNRTTPENTRALVLAHSALRAGNLQSNRTYASVLHEMSANFTLISNPPMAGNNPEVTVSVQDEYPFICNIRKHCRYMALAGAAYLDIGCYDQALKCYLRALTIQAHLGGMSWRSLMEHIIMSLSTLYTRTNQPAKALGILCVAARDGMPSFSGSSSRAQIESLIVQIKGFLASPGTKNTNPLLFLPHMMLPRVRVPKIVISVNTFGEDLLTAEETALVPDQAESEWKQMEEQLRNHLSATKSPVSLPMRKKSKPSMGGSRVPEHYHTLVGEVASVRVPLINNTGAVLTLENVCLLYRPHLTPEAAAQFKNIPDPTNHPQHALLFSEVIPTLMISACSTQTVTLPFKVMEAGMFDIVGLTWTLHGVQCRLYFANAVTDEYGVCKLLQQVDAFDRAVEAREPPLNAPEHVKVVVDGSAAGVKMEFNPPLPSRVRDGFVYKGCLTLTNTSHSCTARHLAISRSENNAHLLYFSDFTLQENEAFDTPIPLGETRNIPPRSSIDLNVTYRAQFDTSSAATAAQQAGNTVANYLPLLLSYATERQGELLPTGGTGGGVRLHKLLRRVMVAPSISIATTVIPPAALTSTPQFTSVVQVSNVSNKTDAPMRISRAIASCESGKWAVKPINPAGLCEDDASGCFLTQKQKLVIPMAISRSSTPGSAAVDSLFDSTGSGSSNKMSDFICLDSQQVMKDRNDTLEKVVGKGVGIDDETLFFVRHAMKGGCGQLGIEDDAGGGWAFFVDGAGGKAGEDGEEASEEQKLLALQKKNMTHYSPVLVSIVWSSTENGALSFGHVFSFVDALAAQRLSTITDWSPKTIPEFAVKNPTHSLNKLVDAFATNSSVTEKRGLVQYTATFPSRATFNANSMSFTNVKGDLNSKSEADLMALSASSPDSAATPAKAAGGSDVLDSLFGAGGDASPTSPPPAQPPTTATTGAKSPKASNSVPTANNQIVVAEPLVVPVKVKVSCYCTQPVNVDITAVTSTNNAFNPTVPFVYVGRTRSRFTLQPDEVRELDFRVAICAPGSYNLNSFEVSATPAKITADVVQQQLLDGESSSAAFSQNAISANKPILQRVTVIGSSSVWRCCVAEDIRAPVSLVAPCSAEAATSSTGSSPTTATAGRTMGKRARSKTTVVSSQPPSLGSTQTATGGGNTLDALFGATATSDESSPLAATTSSMFNSTATSTNASPGGRRPVGRHRTTSMAKDIRPTFARRQHSRTMIGGPARQPSVGSDVFAATDASTDGSEGAAKQQSKPPSNSLLATLEAFQQMQERQLSSDSSAVALAAGTVDSNAGTPQSGNIVPPSASSTGGSPQPAPLTGGEAMPPLAGIAPSNNNSFAGPRPTSPDSTPLPGVGGSSVEPETPIGFVSAPLLDDHASGGDGTSPHHHHHYDSTLMDGGAVDGCQESDSDESEKVDITQDDDDEVEPEANNEDEVVAQSQKSDEEGEEEKEISSPPNDAVGDNVLTAADLVDADDDDGAYPNASSPREEHSIMFEQPPNEEVEDPMTAVKEKEATTILNDEVEQSSPSVGEADEVEEKKNTGVFDTDLDTSSDDAKNIDDPTTMETPSQQNEVEAAPTVDSVPPAAVEVAAAPPLAASQFPRPDSTASIASSGPTSPTKQRGGGGQEMSTSMPVTPTTPQPEDGAVTHVDFGAAKALSFADVKRPESSSSDSDE